MSLKNLDLSSKPSAGKAGLSGAGTAEDTAAEAQVRENTNARLTMAELEITALRQKLRRRSEEIVRLTSFLLEREQELTAAKEAYILANKRVETANTELEIVEIKLAAVQAGCSRIIGQVFFSRWWEGQYVFSEEENHVLRLASFLKESGIVSDEWYSTMNIDVVAARIDPGVHYILYGAKEGRLPSEGFVEKLERKIKELKKWMK